MNIESGCRPICASMKSSLSDDVRARIESNPLRAFDSDHAPTQRVMESAPRLLDQLSCEDLEHFAEVQRLLDAASLSYEIDSTLVRGLDYYTRTVFEFTSDALGAQSGVGGGGRYDGLIAQLGGPDTPASVGQPVSSGFCSRAILPVAAPATVELFVALDSEHEELRASAFGLLCAARSAGLSAQMDLGGRSLKGQLGHASALGARFVAILGDGPAMLKDMQGGGQVELAADEVVHAVLRGHHAL